MLRHSRLGGILASTVTLLAVAEAPGQTWPWPGCPDVTDTDFSYTTLVQTGKAPDPSLLEPVKMDFDMDAQGNVDVYIAERGGRAGPGKVKRYQAATKTVKILATLPTWRGPYAKNGGGGGTEEGLTGIVLDPGFKSNHYLYLHWSPLGTETFRISRFTVTGDSIPLSSEKILLDIPAQRDYCCHTGGGMAFDAYGDLWITIGNNTRIGVSPMGVSETEKSASDEWGAASTHGLRGGILRIHPDQSPKGYSIPAGNFGDYFATQTGKSEYRDTSKVLPEIYVKGTRNAYTLQVDPVRRWAFWGDVGPDGFGTTEEFNLVRHPAFMGWPYFAGNNQALDGGTGKNPAAPTNTSKWNQGLTTLPAATPGIYSYGQSAAMTGPIYRYDGDLNSAVKLPPHFNRKWFVTDYDLNWIKILDLDSSGSKVTGAQRVFANHVFSHPTDFKAGPDGALYVLNYSGYFSSDSNTSIVRIAYTGSCRPAEPKLEKPVTTAMGPAAGRERRPFGWIVNLPSQATLVAPAGMAGCALFDPMGRKVWEARDLRSGQAVPLPASLPQGAYKYEWVPGN